MQGGFEGQATHVNTVHAPATCSLPPPRAPSPSRPHSASAVVAIADIVSAEGTPDGPHLVLEAPSVAVAKAVPEAVSEPVVGPGPAHGTAAPRSAPAHHAQGCAHLLGRAWEHLDVPE